MITLLRYARPFKTEITALGVTGATVVAVAHKVDTLTVAVGEPGATLTHAAITHFIIVTCDTTFTAGVRITQCVPAIPEAVSCSEVTLTHARAALREIVTACVAVATVIGVEGEICTFVATVDRTLGAGANAGITGPTLGAGRITGTTVVRIRWKISTGVAAVDRALGTCTDAGEAGAASGAFVATLTAVQLVCGEI